MRLVWLERISKASGARGEVCAFCSWRGMAWQPLAGESSRLARKPRQPTASARAAAAGAAARHRDFILIVFYSVLSFLSRRTSKLPIPFVTLNVKL